MASWQCLFQDTFNPTNRAIPEDDSYNRSSRHLLSDPRTMGDVLTFQVQHQTKAPAPKPTLRATESLTDSRSPHPPPIMIHDQSK